MKSLLLSHNPFESGQDSNLTTLLVGITLGIFRHNPFESGQDSNDQEGPCQPEQGQRVIIPLSQVKIPTRNPSSVQLFYDRIHVIIPLSQVKIPTFAQDVKIFSRKAKIVIIPLSQVKIPTAPRNIQLFPETCKHIFANLPSRTPVFSDKREVTSARSCFCLFYFMREPVFEQF